MTAIRDEELGRALRELEVPEHEAGFETELRTRLSEPRPRGRLWVSLAAASLALVAAAALALFLPRGAGIASAAEVREAIVDAFGSARSISGVFVNREAGGENRWRFVLDSSGSFRITSVGAPPDLAYDAGMNVETYSDLGLFVTRVGLAPGPPDSDAADWVAERGLGSVVAALASTDDADVKETDYRGRPAWELRTPTGNTGEERLIIVDRESGIPVRNALFRGGRRSSEWRIEELKVDDTGSPTAFTLTPTRGQTRNRYDMGFRRVGLQDAAARAGYRPLVPGWVPEGFERAEVAFADHSRPTGDEQQQNPESRKVVSIRYRRGLDEIVVTTRLTGSDPARWGDPVIGSSPMARQPEQVTFDEGALRGYDGEVVVDPNSVPHVWAIAGQLVVTVAGNLDRDELVRVAGSLRAS